MTTIVVGTDLSDNALDAAQWAFGLARLDDTDPSTTVLVAHVVGADEMQLRRTISDHSEAKERRTLTRQVDNWLDDVDTTDVDYEIEIDVGRQARSLAGLVERHDADWLVVGKSGRGRLRRLFVGSTTEHLAMRPPCPMAIIHPDGFKWNSPAEVLAAVDLSKSATDAAACGAELVRHHGGHLTLLHVISLPQSTLPTIGDGAPYPETLAEHVDESRRWAREELDATLSDHRVSFDDLSPTIDVRPGYPIHEVLNTIEDLDVNLLTLGSQGRSRLAEFVLGGIGRSLLKKAPCSIILAPPSRDDS